MNNNLTKSDMDMIEKLIFKNGDDIAISIGRSFERLEERIDAAESRIYSRLADIEDRVDGARQDISESLETIKEEISLIKKADAE